MKQNVNAFNRDVAGNAGYQYTTNARFSSIVANRRLTEATVATVTRLRPGLKNVLDLGCGDGVYTAELQQAFPEIRFVGVDAASIAIASAQKNHPVVEFHVANALDHGTWPRETFDLAIARGVLHHLPDAKVAIANLVKAAKEVLIIEPNGNNPILKLIEKLSPYHREHEEQSYSSRALRRWSTDAGAEILSLEYVGFIPFFFPTLPAKVIHRVQPGLEMLPVVRDVFSGQIVLHLRSKRF